MAMHSRRSTCGTNAWQAQEPGLSRRESSWWTILQGPHRSPTATCRDATANSLSTTGDPGRESFWMLSAKVAPRISGIRRPDQARTATSW